MSEEIKKITIDVIDTPRGPVPSAESIKKIIESWNSIIEIMNDNLVRLFNLLNKLNENVVKLTINVNNISSKTDLLMKSIAEIKVTLSEIQNSVNKPVSVGNEHTTKTYTEQSDIPSKDSRRDHKLKELFLDRESGTEITPFNLENFVDQGLISKLIVESKLRKTKKSKELIDYLKEYKIIGVSSRAQDLLRHIKVLCSNLDLDCYYIGEIDKEKIGLYESIFKAIKTSLREKNFLLVLLNSDDLLSLADKNVEISRIRFLNVINELLERPGEMNAFVVFHLRSEGNLDPLIAKKLRVFRF